MSDTAISVTNVSKLYRLGETVERYNTLRDTIAKSAAAPFRRLMGKGSTNGKKRAHDDDNLLWALKDVSFEVKRGEVLGIIGRNGAGKSTLLKVLSRITEPTGGNIDMYGRVASLLEVGTGFHPELTGRENIFLNGSILGMRREEIKKKFDAIVDFAGVDRFIDTPVKRYSSGMGVRLGFSVAAHLEPEILIIDEVLAVGDAEFQRKCLGKMEEVGRSGRTVLFVSHNMAAVHRLCTRVISFANGRLVNDGEPSEVVRAYMSSVSNTSGYCSFNVSQNTKSRSKACFLSFGLGSPSGEPIDTVYTHDDWIFELAVHSNEQSLKLNFGIVLESQDGTRVTRVSTIDCEAPPTLQLGVNYVRATIARVNLAPGRYSVTIGLSEPSGGRVDFVERGICIEVTEAPGRRSLEQPGGGLGFCILDSSWCVSNSSLQSAS